MFDGEPVTTARIGPAALPLAILSGDPRLALARWCGDRKDALADLLLVHGALLFRGFAVTGLSDFERFTEVFIRVFTEYEFALTPRLKRGENVATSTLFAPELFLPWHGECCAQSSWPGRLAFCCLRPARSGGETILADARRVYQRLDPAIRERFVRLGLRYQRTMIGKTELELAFRTSERAEIERFCARRGYRTELVADDTVRTEIDLAAALAHPVTGEAVWFNAFHTYYASAYQRSLFHLPPMAEPIARFGISYGDGSAVERHVFDHVWAAYEAETVAFPWQAGDVLLLDNLLVAHGRNPFVGERNVVVAMGDA
jgi:alpha-ketoglutarate-dependent taurine dioxygenase